MDTDNLQWVRPRPAPCDSSRSGLPAGGRAAHGKRQSMQPAGARTSPGPLACRADVVIPYHPANLRWLSASVESVLNQNGVECVVHLIADGFQADDDPAARYAALPNVRWYRNQESIGPYLSLHRIFDRLETDVIAVQDSDDIALPNRLRLSIAALQTADVVGGAMEQFVSHECTAPRMRAQARGTPRLTSGHRGWELSPEGNLVNGTLAMRRQAFERLNGFAPLRGSADLEWATRAHRAGLRVVALPDVLGLRRLHAKSLSNGPEHGMGTPARDRAHRFLRATYRRMFPGFDPRAFGCLDRERARAHLTKRLNGPKVWLRNLELHVAHGCNLACRGCSHFSDYSFGGRLTAEQADREMGLWSHRLKPDVFSLVGGEPTLNPDLSQIVRIARRHWPDGDLQLVTNGFLLQRHPDLPRALEQTRCRLEISVHHQGAEYQQRVAAVSELVARWHERHRFPVRWRPSHARWQRLYQGSGADIRPYADGDPRASWTACRSKWCPQLHDGRLWKCPAVAYLPMLDRKLRLSSEWRPYLAYRPLEPDCSDEALREFVSREVEPVCSMCPANPETYVLPSPLRT